MSLSDFVSSTRESVGAEAVVVADADTHALGSVVPDARSDAGEHDRVLVLVHGERGEEIAALTRLAATLADRSVGVLALVTTPGELPVGPLLRAATDHGLHVIRAEGVHHRRARTVLAVTRDPGLPVTAYLSDTPVTTDGEGRPRLVNEWLVEGLALRAAHDQVCAQLRGAQEEVALLRVRLDELATRSRDERAALHDELAAARKAAREASARAARGPGYRVKRAVTALKDDPVGGSRQLARAAVRRVRR